MIYIGFSNTSHKLYTKILCKNFRHCAVFLIKKETCIIYQFVQPGKIILIPIRKSDIKILKKYGWFFIRYNKKTLPNKEKRFMCLTCVQYTKYLCGIKNIKIQTPDGLFKYLSNK